MSSIKRATKENVHTPSMLKYSWCKIILQTYLPNIVKERKPNIIYFDYSYGFKLPRR